MIKYLIKYRALSVAILVLTPLLLWFSYSELGQFVGEKENTIAQDYCEIVKVIKTETGKVDLSDLFKLKVEKTFCYTNIDATSISPTSYIELDIEHFHTPRKTSKIYLFNSTFLI